MISDQIVLELCNFAIGRSRRENGHEHAQMRCDDRYIEMRFNPRLQDRFFKEEHVVIS